MSEGQELHKTQRLGIGETIRAFLNRESAYGGTLQSTGNTIYSYLYPVGVWKGNKVEAPMIADSMSRTTQRHCRMLRMMATIQGIEIVEVA
jgi:hypothetical protein